MILPELQHLAIPIDDLKPLPGNPRKGDVDAVAKSYERFGQRKPIVVTEDGTVIAGNHQLLAAKKLGWTEIAVVRVEDDEQTAKAFALADNRTADLGSYDDTLLAELLADVSSDLDLLAATGYTEQDLDDLIASIEPEQVPIAEPDAIPDKAPAKTVRGDVWLLGSHRLMCGDSTVPTDVAKLMRGEKAVLVHADPPYGMGKEKDGVQNDNLYGSKLDAFQMMWWATFRPFLEDNGSAYIWGNPEDLWRLWYVGGLQDSERMTYRNEITWDKREDNPTMLVSGVPLESRRMYHPTERCLFFMLGEQGFNNNADNYWEGWEPIRSYLLSEREKAGWNNKIVAGFFGFHPRMADHWFAQSQWSMPTGEQYRRMQAEAKGDAFQREYDDLKREYDDLKREYDDLKQAFYVTRAYFDNTHDNMTDVWEYQRVTGEDRYGHATPKPVAMIERAIKSSAPPNGLVAEPFAGSGTTLIAAQQTGRTCYTMELDERYCDIICARFQKATGIKPIAEATGQEHDFLVES